jgi:hypothetical protein
MAKKTKKTAKSAPRKTKKAPKKAAKKAAKKTTKPKAAKKSATPKKTKLETISLAELAQLKLNNDLSGVNSNHGPELHKHKSKGKGKIVATDSATNATLRAKTTITGRKGTIAQPGRDDIGNRGH